MTFYPVSEYIKLLKDRGLFVSSSVTDTDKIIENYSFDSRAVGQNCLFLAKGLHFKEEFLNAAFESGAVAYVAEKEIGQRGECIIVNDIRKAMAVIAKFFYNNPNPGLYTFGVTGTKGKTSTTTFLRRILDFDAAKTGVPKCGMSNSIDIWDGISWTKPINTTPEAPDIWKYMANTEKSGLKRFVLEISSQAIKYLRVDGIHFNVACITNIGYDHIGPAEHPDLEDYISTKLSLYERCDVACVNLDDENSPRMLKSAEGCRRIIRFGTGKDAEVRLSDVRKVDGGILFTITTPDESIEMRINLPGLFNARNALAASAMAYAAGIPLSTCREALLDAVVPGRMEAYVSRDRMQTVIVDYAHNALSFDTLFDSLEREYPGHVLITVYGWHGSKAENRRKDIGLITGRRAAFTVITEKDPADEPFEHIAADAAQWIASVGGKYAVVMLREDALKYALNLDFGNKPKIIAFAGRGEEDWQRRGAEYFPYPADNEIAQKLIAEYDGTHPVKEEN